MIPREVVRIDLRPICFNERLIREVFIDMDHINKGKEKRLERSDLSLEFVLKFVFLLNELSLEPEMMRGSYTYFSKVLRDEFEKTYKIVFCQDHSLNWIGVITLYRIRVKHEN
jgi:hypothetical protein